MSNRSERLSSAGTRRFGRLLRLAAAVVLAVSCGRSDSSVLLGPVVNPLDQAVVQLAPQAVTLSSGGSYQFEAVAILPDNSQIVPDVIWTATGGTITATGLFTAGTAPGTYQVSAQIRNHRRSGSAPVTVAPVTLTVLTLSPSTAAMVSGATQQFTVAGVWSDGTTSTPAMTYSAAGGTITATGLYTAGTTPGTFRVVATQQGGTKVDTAVVTITAAPPTLTQMVLSPAALSLTTGISGQFSVTGTWSDGTTTAPAVAYSAAGGTITSGGLYTAGTTPGSFRVIASQQGGTKVDTAMVTITALPPTLTQMVLSPASLSLAVGTTGQFSVTGTWSDGTTSAPAVTYSATGGTITPTGLYTAGTMAGTFRVIATQQGGTKVDTAAVTITAVAPTLAQMVLSPARLSLATSATGQFSVTGTWSDGTTTAPAVTYSATGGTITPTGLYTAGTSPGTFRVIATQQGGTKVDSAAVTITASAPTLTQMVLSPATLTLASGATKQFTVTGKWSDSSTTAPVVTFSATGGTITASGLYTAGSTAGTFRVIASQQGGTKVDTSAVTITAPPPTLTQMLLSPAALALAPGGTGQFSVAGTWSDGTSSAPVVTYSVTGGTITAGGLYTAGTTAGTFRVIATQTGGTKVDTALVTVAAPLVPLWKADMETGDLNQWEDNIFQATPCGGQFNSGPLAVTVPSQDYSHSGLWSAKMTIGGDTENGTRMFRWCEPARNRELFYSVWYYIPQRLTVASGGWMSLFQYKSMNPGTGSVDPFFFLELRNAPDGSMRLGLTWWNGLTIEGPSPGQVGYRTWQTAQTIPVGRWFNIQARYVCASDFTGAIQVWQDNLEIFNLSGVRTSYENVDCRWGVNNYGIGITPSPVVIYIDDAAIARTKILP